MAHDSCACRSATRRVHSDVTDPAKQLALVEAQFKAWRTAVTQLLGRADVKALRLKPVEVEAYTAVILDDRATAHCVDLADVARRMAMLRKDQDATYDIVDTWSGMQQLHQQLARAAARPNERGSSPHCRRSISPRRHRRRSPALKRAPSADARRRTKDASAPSSWPMPRSRWRRTRRTRTR